jgi:predicted CopG family antitoxin
MGTKRIAISDEAYQILKALKRSGESFTDVIERMTRKSSVLELAGVLSKGEVTTVERHVKEIRKRSSRRIHVRGRTVNSSALPISNS